MRNKELRMINKEGSELSNHYFNTGAIEVAYSYKLKAIS